MVEPINFERVKRARHGLRRAPGYADLKIETAPDNEKKAGYSSRVSA